MTSGGGPKGSRFELYTIVDRDEASEISRSMGDSVMSHIEGDNSSSNKGSSNKNRLGIERELHKPKS